MRIAILGPLDVTDEDGRPVAVAGARLRALLIRLALDAGRTVRIDALTDAVWAGEPPAGTANALQTLVSRLRRSLPAAAVTADPAGYRVTAAVDVDEFESHIKDARAAVADGDLARARARYADAHALWRGDALADVAGADFARAPIARLAEARVAATEEHLAVRFAIDGGQAVIADLDELAAAHPLREQPHRLLIAALADAGRAGDAVGVYTRFRERLGDDLGLDPSPEMTAAYAAMLRGERSVAAGQHVLDLGARAIGSVGHAANPGAGDKGAGDRDAGNKGAENKGAGSTERVDDARPGNLRPALTSFVGRDAEVQRVAAAVRDNRLVTVVGPGGAGKTRLAVEAAYGLRADFAGGAWLVELAPVRLGDDVLRAIAESLHGHERRRLEERTAGPLPRLVELLGTRHLLLILDNCEHLIRECAAVVEELLTRCPGVRILTTSREPLGITSEVLSPLGPLATPTSGAAPAEVAAAAAVRLFADRAAAVRPGFRLDAGTDANTLGAVAEICRRLDGMPLAIELACARLRTMPVDQIAARLDDRFRLLTGGSRTALPRHQTLAAVVEWSWDLLDPSERDLAMRFAVFAGGASLDTIVELCGADSVGPLAGLVDKSFVVLGDDGRYRMLETIRAYAAERLADSGSADVARKAHADFFTDLAERADGHLRGRGQQRALRHFRAERDNMTAALQWAVDTGDGVTAIRLASALGWYWMMSDYHSDAVTWLGQALELRGPVPPAARARALALYGMNVAVVAPEEYGHTAVDEAAALAPDDPIVVLSQVLAGVLPLRRDAALEVLPIALGHEDPWVRAMATTMRGILYMYAGDPDGAERDLTDGLAGFEAVGDDWARAMLGGALGELRALRGDTEGAVAALRRSASIAESLGVEDVAAQSMLQLSRIRARDGDLDGAQADAERARETAMRLDSHVLHVGVGGTEAEITRRRGDLVGARDRYVATIASIVDVRAIPRETYAGLLAGLMFTQHLIGDRAAVRRTAATLLAQTVREHIVVVIATMAFASVLSDIDPAESAFLIGVADAMRGTPELGNPDATQIIAAIRERLGDEAYDSARDRGRQVGDIDAALAALQAALPTIDTPTIDAATIDAAPGVADDGPVDTPSETRDGRGGHAIRR
ncbi:MAG TPA: BTAD domain-containing putative transcriptional regulator [Micromonosporaceae bacterium]|nr:BTAD domain-containing putative transcriptional regulator [Micromonosporaceae bacterium]